MSSLLSYDYTNTLFLQIFGIYHTRGKEFRKYQWQGFESEEYKDSYEWQRERLFIDGFDWECINIADSYLDVGDESMSAIRFWNTVKGDLPHLSYIFCKPEPLGT